MGQPSRIDDLRGRIQKDPASIAFAQLAEECRRAGLVEEAIEACRAGLAIHPGYLSARVTLGRALLEADRLDEAQREMETVLGTATQSLAAIRGLAEIHRRRGRLAESLVQYQRALGLARNDPDLLQVVRELTAEIAASAGGLEDVTAEARTLVALEQFLAAIHAARDHVAHPHVARADGHA